MQKNYHLIVIQQQIYEYARPSFIVDNFLAYFIKNIYKHLYNYINLCKQNHVQTFGNTNSARKIRNKIWRPIFLTNFEEPNLSTKFMNMHEQVFETKFKKKSKNKIRSTRIRKAKVTGTKKMLFLVENT